MLLIGKYIKIVIVKKTNKGELTMKKRPLLTALVIALSLSIFISISAYAVGGEYYYITWNFNSTLTGATRSFSGRNISLSGSSSSQATGDYAITLYKDNLFSDTKIGSRYVPKTSSFELYWSPITAGDYYLYMGQAPYTYPISGSGTLTSY